MIFWAGSSRREGTSSGRRCSCRAASAIRAERLEERTEAKVAIASTSVPAPVARAEIVAQSVASGTISDPYPAGVIFSVQPLSLWTSKFS